MSSNFLFLDLEFFIFIFIEGLIIIPFFIFFKYSRYHGGVFDRRVGERRIDTRRIDYRRDIERRYLNAGFSNSNVGLGNSQTTCELDIDRRVNDRRNNDRRLFTNRRDRQDRRIINQ